MPIKGIEKAQPTRPDPRQPITLEVLSKCISTLHKGYHSAHTARTLDAMFILAFGFLRCSELTVTANFNPKLHPTFSDLSIIDPDTILHQTQQDRLNEERPLHLHLQPPVSHSTVSSPFSLPAFPTPSGQTSFRPTFRG